MLRAGSVSTGVTGQAASLAIYRRVLVDKIGTAGGYRAHICGFWRPVYCLSATAVLKNFVLPCKDAEAADHHTLSHRDAHHSAALRALAWQIGPV